MKSRTRRERGTTEQVDIARVLADLVEVLVWTSSHGAWQEDASFLLRTRDGGGFMVGFAEPAAAELVSGLSALPGYDPDRLFELLGHADGNRLVSLWKHPTEPSRSPTSTGAARC